MFVKLFTQILDSSIADNRPLRHFFTDLLLCADGDGNVVMTDAAIARRIGATLEEVQWGLGELQKPDPTSKTPDREGRRIEKIEGTGYGWHIINFETYRALKDSDQLRAVTRERVKRFRDKKKAESSTNCNVTETQGNGSNAIQKESKRTEGEEEPEKEPRRKKRDICLSDAESIYSLYPRKVDKKNALDAIQKIIGSPPRGMNTTDWIQSLRAATSAYAKSREKEDPAFTPYPATWFNARRFEDDQSEWMKSTKPQQPELSKDYEW